MLLALLILLLGSFPVIESYPYWSVGKSLGQEMAQICIATYCNSDSCEMITHYCLFTGVTRVTGATQSWEACCCCCCCHHQSSFNINLSRADRRDCFHVAEGVIIIIINALIVFHAIVSRCQNWTEEKL